ncbi:hypothetical protein BO70DRAFT_333031 [Aspergillus heteromorphus CBS 117.55]|uniref:Xylanolytic transcriptional activator regulatory domain-containing protein n=1 Tax=Aspergillus heteromorphus CBS 117.55 TaxID=1448321 RepID=A0A317WNL6_9EURO|nr:uncharacterized protein BO70DRAFT_333031 [Aspergillus heteromorphus CBS 117.55]PWY86647.1 hypothetical protein BO70DRAFT_333031 [Aspergillus heteromorphus CBS 117.55]
MPTPEEGPSVHPSPRPATTPDRIRGTGSKTRVSGAGHWMSTFSRLDGLATLQPIGEYYEAVIQPGGTSGPLQPAAERVAQCKRLARVIKEQRPSRRSLPADTIHRFLPNRQVVSDLVTLYFATFEYCYRILHLQSFRAECQSCMDDPEAAESSSLLQVLLVLTMAGPLHDDADVRSEIAEKAPVWIHIAETWLCAPLEKSRLTLKAIQIHCLLVLSRQLHQVGADLVWISVGALVRMAMQMGLHQDPTFLGEASLRQKEMRRRLWYTILEMNAQAALDAGMSPMITDEDYNTLPPSNLSDQDLDDMIQDESPNQISFQQILARSLPLRLRATRVINRLQAGPSYSEVLELGNQLASACRDVATAIDQTALARSASQFASNFCSHLINRFLLYLHFSYAIKATTNPLYSHSRKVCLETALDLVSFLHDDVYQRVLLRGGGMFRDIITRGALVIFVELSSDTDERTSIFAIKRSRSRREGLLQDARRVVQYSKDRISQGDTNVRGYVFLSMMMAQAEARVNGSPVEAAIATTLNQSLETCHGILKGMAGEGGKLSTPDVEFWASHGMVPPEELDVSFDSDFDESFLDFSGSQQWGETLF